MASLPLDIARIYLEPAVDGYARGREILARFPDAERIPVASHWRIPELRDGDPGDYLAAKKQALVLGVKQGLTFRPNGRSADFIAPSTSNGCAMACAYCYVARRKGHANPVSVFVNIEAVSAAIPELHRAGYEVHLNFSPVVLREGWEAKWGALFAELDDVLPAVVKDQLAAEVIMLTHNEELHETNLAWHPKAEELLWRPDIQEQKVSEGGGVNLRYRTGWKGQWLGRFKGLLTARMPYCRVSYAF